MKNMMYGGAALGLLAGLLATPQAQQALPMGTPIDVSKLGPQVGQRIPAFALTDHEAWRWNDARRRNERIDGPSRDHDVPQRRIGRPWQ